MKLLYSLLGLALLLTSVLQAGSLATIQLHNRPAEEIIPVVKPMLAPGEAITGQGFKLFLRSSAETLEQVEAMLDVLDAAAKMLQISVFQGSRQDLESQRIDGHLKIEGDDASAGVGSGNDEAAGSVNYNSGDVSGGMDASATRERGQSNPIHRLRVSEGREGYIETGRQIPYFTVFMNASAEYRKVSTGFYVLPRIHGDSVTLEISPFKNSLSQAGAGSVDTQSATTVISGRIGDWLQIGGVSETSSSSQNGIGSYATNRGRKENSIWIRADLAR
jgi:hypothetical protein